MAELRVRNVDPWAVDVIRAMARRSSQTMEQFLKHFIYELADREKRELMAELRKQRGELQQTHGVLPDSTPGIRAERDDRW